MDRPNEVDPEVSGASVRALLDVGHQGASYLATDAEGREVELWRLSDRDLHDGRRLEILAATPHPGLLPIRTLGLDRDPPHVLVEAPGAWADAAAWAPDVAGVRAQLATLADGLARCHRWDVVHGRIGAGVVARASDGRLWLDMTGLEVRAPVPVELAPELARARPTAAADVWGLAALARRTARAAQDDPGLRTLLSRMTAEDPEERPTAAEVARELADGSSTSVDASQTTAPPVTEGAFPAQLGAYRLEKSIGAGGMGKVFLARDQGSGREVALKVLLPSWATDPELVKRFRREARVLAQLQSPFVTRFVAANEDQGFHYLVMELATGQSAKRLRVERERLDVDLATAIVADAARALAEVHALGLVHRDVKPANILVDLDAPERPAVKLCDFGIARPEIPAADDDLTRDGTPGTPSFMAPEQVEGRPVDARTDVYALGCTLFDLLTGRGPFTGAGPFIMVCHVTQPAPRLREIEPSVPPAIDEVVARCLQKAPEDRYPDAGAFLEDLERARRGAAASVGALPQPLGLEGAPKVYDFRWPLRSAPDALWPHVSNTERLNRAAGLDDVEWSHEPQDQGYVRTEGRFRAAGMELRWRENPFEWVAPRRLGVVREYVSGPFEWLRSTVELNPTSAGGTDLRHQIEIRPRGLIGRAAATVEVGLRLRMGLERVYQHIDAACQSTAAGTRNTRLPDPFEDPARARGAQARADALVPAILAAGTDPTVVSTLVAYLATAPGPSVARIRPRAWAREHGLDEDAVLDACLVAAHEGLLEVLWDLLCPSCRVPSGIEQTLKELTEHGHCEVCDLDFELDMARSVELVFRAHPSVREADLGIYCIGGPAHSPHVLAQVRLAAGERFALELGLEPGRYVVTGRGLPARWGFAVDPRAPLDTWDLPLRAGAPADAARSLAPGSQLLLLSNDLPHEVVARVERAAPRDDAVTAADAACSARFRALFPEQVLNPERLVAISNTALLFATLPGAIDRYEDDEAAVHRELIALSRLVEDCAALEGGALVKLHGDGVMAVFSDRVAAVRAALAVARKQSGVTLAAHAGPARMTTIGGRLDYFGRTLHVTEQMSRWDAPGELLVSESLLADPTLAPLVTESTQAIGYLQVGTLLISRLEVMPALS